MLIATFALAQNHKITYLKSNRFDLRNSEFKFPQSDFKVIGFGAYHGSQKTEDVELTLLSSLIQEGEVDYYLPETDFSTALFFDRYLANGDTVLLYDLLIQYGDRVPQERALAVYEKWKSLKKMNDALPLDRKIKVIGIDQIANYKYSLKHLIELFDFDGIQGTAFRNITAIVESDTSSFSAYYHRPAKLAISDFITAYEQDESKLSIRVKNKPEFDRLILNFKRTIKKFDLSQHREKAIFDNYVELSEVYDFRSKPQFVRFGFFHLEKSREGNNASFFTMLIENNIYQPDQVVSVIGYFKKSQVLWDTQYDDNGNYKGFENKAGFGIGDYWKEYFRGIKNLKKNSLSDLTLFRLNQPDSPYRTGGPDLIEVKMIFSKSNGKMVKNKPTANFIDYAVLIENSNASLPLETLHLKK